MEEQLGVVTQATASDRSRVRLYCHSNLVLAGKQQARYGVMGALKYEKGKIKSGWRWKESCVKYDLLQNLLNYTYYIKLLFGRHLFYSEVLTQPICILAVSNGER